MIWSQGLGLFTTGLLYLSKALIHRASDRYLFLGMTCCLHHWRWTEVMFSLMFVCLSMSRISQKVVNEFGQNSVDRSGVWQGRIDSILLKIRIQIWESFYCFFIVILHNCEMGPKTICSMISQKLVDGLLRNLVDELGRPRWQEEAD